MTNSTTDSSNSAISVSSMELLFLRLCSALEAVTIYILIVEILPKIYKKINRSSFYKRLGLTYILILLFLVVRFYDFLETNIFRSMSNEDKLRFLLYFIGPLECMFDLSLVCLSLETLLDLTSTYISDKKLWIQYLIIAVGVPVFFLFLVIVVWETEHTFKGVLTVAICQSALPAVSIFILLVVLYVISRKKYATLNDDQVFKIKLMIGVNTLDTISAVTNLVLYLCSAELIMDDLLDSLMKFGVSWWFMLVLPGSWSERYVLSSFNNKQSQKVVSSINHAILREEQNSLDAIRG